MLQSDFSELSHIRTWRSHLEKNGKKQKFGEHKLFKRIRLNEEPQKMNKHIRR